MCKGKISKGSIKNLPGIEGYIVKFEDVLESEEETMSYYNLIFVNQEIDKNCLFKLPLNIQLKRGRKVFIDTSFGELMGACVTDSFIVDMHTAKQIIEGTRSGIHEPLKEIVGLAEKQDGYKCIYFDTLF